MNDFKQHQNHKLTWLTRSPLRGRRNVRSWTNDWLLSPRTLRSDPAEKQNKIKHFMGESL